MVEPNVELPKEEPKPEAKTEVDVDGLMAELTKAGIENPQQLQGKLDAGSEVGRVAQLLGDERKRSRDLEAEIAQLQAASVKDEFDYSQENRPIDIEAVIEKKLGNVLDARDAKARKAQEKSYAAWNKIQTDEDYHLVKEVWEEKLKDPGFVMKIQNGSLNPVDEYTSTLRKYYKTLLKQSHETITTMKGGDLKPPHVETGERTPANLVSEGDKDTSAERKLLDAMAVKVAKGYIPTEDEEILIAEATIKAGVGNAPL